MKCEICKRSIKRITFNQKYCKDCSFSIRRYQITEFMVGYCKKSMESNKILKGLPPEELLKFINYKIKKSRNKKRG